MDLNMLVMVSAGAVTEEGNFLGVMQNVDADRVRHIATWLVLATNGPVHLQLLNSDGATDIECTPAEVYASLSPPQLPPDIAKLRHLLYKVREVCASGHSAWIAQSKHEKVVAALVLNKPEWLQEMDCTLMEAISIVGPTSVPMLQTIQRELVKSSS